MEHLLEVMISNLHGFQTYHFAAEPKTQSAEQVFCGSDSSILEASRIPNFVLAVEQKNQMCFVAQTAAEQKITGFVSHAALGRPM